jgi:hypothetical protein
MKKTKVLILYISFISFLFLVSGCTNYEPVSVKECSAVVKHAQKVLGKLSPPYKELLKSCTTASDEVRGCIMAAEKMGQITQCN